MDLIETGKIVNTHGIKGDVKVLLWTSDVDAVLSAEEIYVDGEPFYVENARVHGGSVLFKLRGTDTPESVNLLRNKTVSVPRSVFSLEEGEYFISDLIGLSVFDADNETFYGKITDVMQSGANDVYELTDGNVKRYVPAIKDCIVSVDIVGGVMKIRPLEGLFDV